MDKKENDTRVKKLVNCILDAGFEEITKLSIEATYAFIQAVKEWVINKYNEVKSSSDNDAKVTLEDLERHIKMVNENEEIGIRRKEIDIMYAMQKLGYSEEQIQQVVGLANTYHKKKE